jgi:lysocardiolipin and lysophospholipid acyltransferase
MALTKQSFGLLVTTMTQWWSPTVVRISGDESIAGQIKQRADGRVEFSFPDRLVMIANHQVNPATKNNWLKLIGIPALHGLAISLVGRLCKQAQPSWSSLHNPQRIC